MHSLALLGANVVLPEEGVAAERAVARHLGVGRRRVVEVTLLKRSLDARQKRKRWVAVFRVVLKDEATLLARGLPSVRPFTERDGQRYGLVPVGPQRTSWSQRPIVVGAGPAGLFAALWLAEAGAPVQVLERGGPVEERVTAVNGFWRRTRPLDPESPSLLFDSSRQEKPPLPGRPTRNEPQ